MTINIPEPCTQSWDSMEERSIGRHCNSCNKTVVDFTNFTDDQLIAFFQRSVGNVCGRIETRRMNIPLVIPPLPKRNRIKWLYPLTAILSLLGFNKTSAQNANTSNPNSNPKSMVEHTPLEKDDSTVKIRQTFIEIMISGTDGNPLTNVSLKIKCTGYDSLEYTLEKGLLKIPTAQLRSDTIEIIISDADHYGNLVVSASSLSRYYIVLATAQTVTAYREGGTIYSGVITREITSDRVRRSRGNLSNFEMRSLSEKIRYQQNQY